MTVPLPPLPPAPGDDEAYRPGGRSMLAVLADEHRRITGLCRELLDRATDERRRAELVEVVVATVTRHLSAEEQYLYPTIRATVPAGEPIAEREIAADLELLRVLEELSGTAPDDPGFAGPAGELADRLRRHVRAAEVEIFPPLREAASEAELIRLGNRLLVAEEAAPTRPHLGTPATPPWNRVVDPAVGVVDKVRDAVNGRRTYAEDLEPGPAGS